MATKLIKYGFVEGVTNKNGRQYNWLRFDFTFQTVDGQEYTVSAFPRNTQLVSRLIGLEDKEIVHDTTIRNK